MAFFAIYIGLIFSPCNAAAETTVDIYIGQAKTSSSDITVTDTEILSSTTATRNVNFDTSHEIGGTAVGWSDLEPSLGFGVDLSIFQANGEGADISIVAFSFLLMTRMPVYVSEEFETGRLQPYMGFGLILMEASGDFDFRPDLPDTVSVSGRGVGPDFRLGLRWFIKPDNGIFAQFRYTSASPDMQGSIFPDSADVNLNTTHITFGISIKL